MENSQLSKGREQGRSDIRNERWMKMFQPVTLVFLALFWIGYAVSYYRGIENNISTYGILIMTFSLLNQEVLFKGRRHRIKCWIFWQKQKESCYVFGRSLRLFS